MGKIVGHCTVGWQVNEAQMAGPKARRGGAAVQGHCVHGGCGTAHNGDGGVCVS